MKLDRSYSKAFYAALAGHILLACLLLFEASQKSLSLNQNQISSRQSTTNVKSQDDIAANEQRGSLKSQDVVKAVNIDSKKLMEAVAHLKQQRQQQAQQEEARQQKLAQQAAMARVARMQEQERLMQIKEETKKLEIAQKKQVRQKQNDLNELAQEKMRQINAIKELESKQTALKKQQEELERSEEIKRKQIEKQRLANEQAKKEKERKQAELMQKIKEQQAQEEKRQEEKRQAQLAETKRIREAAALVSEKKAKLASEVEKYKALIVRSISSQWILPENTNNRLSSQFRIRLAPDGAVLEVNLLQSSGDAILDRSAHVAIYKASPLPVPADPETFALFRDITLTVRPESNGG